MGTGGLEGSCHDTYSKLIEPIVLAVSQVSNLKTINAPRNQLQPRENTAISTGFQLQKALKDRRDSAQKQTQTRL